MLVAAFWSAALPGHAQTLDFFPLQIGNTWTYADFTSTATGAYAEPTGAPPDTFTVAVVDTQRIGGLLYYEFDDGMIRLFGFQKLYRKDEDGNVYVYDLLLQRECLRFLANRSLLEGGADTWYDRCLPDFYPDWWDGFPMRLSGTLPGGIITVCDEAESRDASLRGFSRLRETIIRMAGLAAGRQIQRYRAKLSGPLLDRIDIHIDVPAVPYKELAGGASGEASVIIRERVNRARERQLARFGDTRGTFCNAQMESADLRRFCELDVRGHDLLKLAMTKLGLSARAYDRVLKVARTIADLEGVEGIRPEHVSEAIQYRSLDRSPWG